MLLAFPGMFGWVQDMWVFLQLAEFPGPYSLHVS